MTDPAENSKRQRQFEREANDRFHDHGKHISRIEGIFEERTRALAEADHEQRAQIASVANRIDKIEDRLTAKIEYVGRKVETLGNDIVRQGVKIAVGVSVLGGIGVVALNTFVRVFVA